ncbi:MAG: hypothetical protein ACI8QC_001241 [Planctomycetota bacterium]
MPRVTPHASAAPSAMKRTRSIRLSLLLALLAGSGASGAVALQDKVATAREPKTDVLFPVSRMAEDGKTKLVLAGTGLRDKRMIFNFKVYAYGFYVDPVGAKKTLGRWNGKSMKQLKEDQGFYDALLKDDFAKSLRLVFVRDVDGDDVEEAFSGSIEPRIKKTKDKTQMREATKAMAKFKGFFDVKELEEGDEVIFTWLPGGKLETTVKGKRRPQIQSSALCWALFDIYLGKKPIESKGKATMVDRIPALLK